jgi:Cd2+/Zn2+-exporting ATPase
MTDVDKVCVMAKVDLKIHGMDCVEEVATLKAKIQPMPGVADLSFNILEGRLAVTYSDTGLTQDDLIAAISQTGLRAEPFPEVGTIARDGTHWDRWGRTVLTMTRGRTDHQAVVPDTALRLVGVRG